MYEYTFIISTGCNVKKKKRQWANYCKTTQVLVAYAQVTRYISNVYSKCGKVYYD